MPAPVLLRHVVLDGRLRHVLLVDGRVAVITDAPDDLADPPAATERVDADGAVLLPGLRDEHVHLGQWATARRRVDVSAAGSPREAAELMAAAAGDTPHEAELLLGHGFRYALWAERPTAAGLDEVMPGRAVALVSSDLHTAWCSTAAARLLDVRTDDGLLREDAAMAVFAKADAQVPVGTLDTWVDEAMQAAAARGITGVTDFEYADAVTVWARRAAARPDGPPMRVDASIWLDWLDATIDAGLHTGDHIPGVAGDPAVDRLRIGPVKIFVDGSLGTRTAYCEHAYADPVAGAPHGLLVTPPEQLEALLRKASAAGLATAVHAIGDAANTVTLDAYAAVGCRGRVEHAQQLRPADVGRFAALGLVASIQPRHVVDDRDAVDHIWAGGADRAYRYADLVASGATVVLGSDAPVAPLDPWDAVASAVHRTIDERPPWQPTQQLTLAQALAAASGGRTNVQEGDVADLVLVAEHPQQVYARDGADGLRGMQVFGTMVGGAWTFRATG